MIPIPADSKPNHWLSVAIVNSEEITPKKIIEHLQIKNIEARYVWKPMQLQPVFENCDYIQVAEESVSQKLFELGICLPSDTKMTDDVQSIVIDEILDLVNKKGV